MTRFETLTLPLNLPVTSLQLQGRIQPDVFFWGGGEMVEMAPFFPCTAIGVMLKLGSFGEGQMGFGGSMALNAPPWIRPCPAP